MIPLSTPTVYSQALPTSSHSEENYTGAGRAKGHPLMEIGSRNWLCILVSQPACNPIRSGVNTHSCTVSKKHLSVVVDKLAMGNEMSSKIKKE